MKSEEKNKEFAKGIWFCVECLLGPIDEPTIAEELINESGIDIKVFRKILNNTKYNTKILNKFLDGIQN